MDAIETINGQALYSGSRELPWHQLGTTVDADLTVAEALDLAYLSGWNLRTEPLGVIHSGGMQMMEPWQIVMRDNPVSGDAEGLAPVGPSYQPVQNEELAAFAQAITNESDLVMDACGSLNSGRRVFLTLRAPQVLLGGTDPTQPYLVVANANDGTMSVVVTLTAVRVVCQNTLDAALSGHSPKFTVRHTGSTIENKVDQARESLGITGKVMEALDRKVSELLTTPYTDAQFGKAVETIAPLPEGLGARTVSRRETTRDDLWSLFRSPTNEVVKGTAWGAVQAVTEYADWYGAGSKDADKRALRNLFGGRDEWKADASRKVLAQV